MSDETSTERPPRPQDPGPNPRLRDLDVLAGTWHLEGRDPASGESFTGTVTRAWLPGGYFLTQRTETDGHPSGGTEFIGWDSSAGGFRSMLFSDEGPGPFCPFALEYFWDIDGDRLTIFHGYRDSPARFTGTIDRAALTVAGRWEWPGGGYDAIATRMAD